MNGRPDHEVPPSVLAARRRASGRKERNAARAYPDVQADADLVAVHAQLAATRALLSAEAPADVVAIIATLVRDLGGGLVPARLAEAEAALQIDVALGLSEPMLPWAEPVSVGAMRLAQVLPGFVSEARAVFDRLQGDDRRLEEAERDSLTGLLTRRAWMRRLSGAGPGDAVCVIDLDRFKAVNDTHGHAAGDRALRVAGALLLAALRPSDACGRLGGDELVCLAAAMPAAALARRMDDFRSTWQEQRPPAAEHVGLSVGVAAVGAGLPLAALEAADRALYRVKEDGRNATAVATLEDDERRQA